MKKEFFDKCASQWHYPGEEKYKFIDETVIPLLELQAGDRVLDACCGTGALIPLLKGKCASITGLDYSKNMLDKAEERFSADAEFVLASMENMPFRDREFEKIICHNSFPHIDDKNKAFKECFRVLKPGGIFLISHDANKHEIDAHHKQCDKAVSGDMLPSNDETILFAANAAFATVEIIDEENFYAVICKK